MILQIVQYLEQCSLIKELGLAYWNAVKCWIPGQDWNSGKQGDCLEKCKRKGKGKIKNLWEIVWPERVDALYLTAAISNNSPRFNGLASVISALKNLHLHSFILQLEYWISDLFWLRHIVVSDLLKSWFHLCCCQMPDYLLSPISLHLKNCPSFLAESFLLVCHSAGFLTTCLSDHYNWQAFTFYSTLGKQLPYGKHILFDGWFIQELVLGIIAVSYSGLLLFFLYFPAGLFEA